MFERYEKQVLFKPIGLNGQQTLSEMKVSIVGIGALGTNIADILVRSGIGYVNLIDSDRVELSNLQRQTLFSEIDVDKYKAAVALEKLQEINSSISINANVCRITEENAKTIISDVDIVFDATDNFETRFIINKICFENNIPWVHSGVTAASGQSIIFVPGKTACFKCLVQETPDMESFPTVHNSGIITSIVTIISSMSAASGVKFLIDRKPDLSLKFYDTWSHSFQKIKIEPVKNCCVCSKYNH